MKIGVDTFGCNIGTSEVGVYVLEVLQRARRQDCLCELFGWEFDRYAYAGVSDTMDFVPVGRISGKMANSLWHVFSFQRFCVERGYSVCFFPAAHRRLPARFPCFSVGTVHDLAAYWGTHGTREHLGAVLRLKLPDALRHLDRVIAVSEWVKQELVESVHVRESRIDVVPNGVDTALYHPRSLEDGAERVVGGPLMQPFGFRRPYILYAARLHHPIKNHVGLIHAFEAFKHRTGLPHRLVLAGADDHGSNVVRSAALSSPYYSDIFVTGNFPSKSLPMLYSGADFVVIPSLYEGFGQGALLAMASGVPVAVARSGALPETAGYAALYFEPTNTEDMADRMVTLATDTATRESLIAAGLEHVKNYSWDACAERTLQIIRDEA
jgi:glycosyltransferase involved in cell wall biosynthesis